MRTLLLLAAIIACVWSEICPPEEDIKPCICEICPENSIAVMCYADDEDFTLEEIGKAFKSLHGKRNVTIKMDGINLGRVPSNYFEGIKVVSLSMDDCELESLSDDGKPALSGLEDSLKHLEIYSSIKDTCHLPMLKLGHLRNLRYLALRRNAIAEIGNDLFGVKQIALRSFSLDNNGIMEVGNSAFVHLIGLKSAYLDGNKISSIRRGMFPRPADHLNNLYLMHNDLTRVPQDMFISMPSLRRVSIAFNKLRRLDQATWEPIWEQLTYLDLTGNPLVCDSKMNWMLDVRSPSNLEGTCAAPEEERGVTLETFINSKRKLKN